ncbi:hypothetical protein GF412_03655 [Candidatus Micrarchaeota archaeon]|nr:hypothetical protein [Candidatus Micrarchaeota archaeon]MBD3418045.1 hypothetical protein [Candidatus Micrarchaeota archaeon]
MEKAGLLLIMAVALMVPGCPQQEEPHKYSVDSLAIEGTEHSFSGSYAILLELSEGSFKEGNKLLVFDNNEKIFERNLTGEAPRGNQIYFEWLAREVGNHSFATAVYNSSNDQVSGEKKMAIVVQPLGFYDFENGGMHHPVEEGVWCAQKFSLENPIQVKEAGLQLRSLVSTQKGTLVILEVHGAAEGAMPGGLGEPLATSSMPATGVGQNPEWHSFEIGKEMGAGSYWLVLKRDHSLGNVAWTYADGENANDAYCRDLAVSEEWFPVEGSFAFKLQ